MDISQVVIAQLAARCVDLEQAIASRDKLIAELEAKVKEAGHDNPPPQD